MYRDGGTIEISTDKGIFCIDGRISSHTPGLLYEGYPDGNNKVNSPEIESELMESLKTYENEFYQTSIDYLLKTYISK